MHYGPHPTAAHRAALPSRTAPLSRAWTSTNYVAFLLGILGQFLSLIRADQGLWITGCSHDMSHQMLFMCFFVNACLLVCNVFILH